MKPALLKRANVDSCKLPFGSPKTIAIVSLSFVKIAANYIIFRATLSNPMRHGISETVPTASIAPLGLDKKPSLFAKEVAVCVVVADILNNPAQPLHVVRQLAALNLRTKLLAEDSAEVLVTRIT